MALIPPATFNSSHFILQSPVLTIFTTDATIQMVAPRKPNILTLDDERCRASKEEWLRKLGMELVQKFLAVGIEEQLEGKKEKEYWLEDFPQGYVFYMQQRGETAKKTQGRYDCYLVGAGRKFRSPREFVYHAAWLMAGKPNSQKATGYMCACKYCTPSKQTDINNFTKIKMLEVMAKLREAKVNNTIIDRRVNAMNKAAYLKRTEEIHNREEVVEEGSDEGSTDQEDLVHREQVMDYLMKKVWLQHMKRKNSTASEQDIGTVEMEVREMEWEMESGDVSLPADFWNETDDALVKELVGYDLSLSPGSAGVHYADLPV